MNASLKKPYKSDQKKDPSRNNLSEIPVSISILRPKERLNTIYVSDKPQIIVPKKIFKTAILRNKAKRRITQAFTLVYKDLGLCTHDDTVVTKNTHEIRKSNPVYEHQIRLHAKITVLKEDFQVLKEIIKKELVKYT